VLFRSILPDGRVQFEGAPSSGQFIRAKGEFRQPGAVLIPRGTLITPTEIGILVGLNRFQVPVHRPPIVGILSTGDELVPLGTVPQLGQVLDSNQPTLCALVRQAGAIPRPLGIVRDQPEALREALLNCGPLDFLISSGGVSVGSYDYVETILAELGAEILVRQVNMKPGKPLTFAHWQNKLYWGLPGNPMSAFVGFWVTVYPALRKAMGYTGPWRLPEISIPTLAPLTAGGDRRHYLRGRLFWQTGGYQFYPFGSDNSANIANLSGINAFALIEPGVTRVETGENIVVMVLPRSLLP